ncbi:hypothetical protein JCM5296_006498 [Sporobolomyces johnsonii]
MTPQRTSIRDLPAEIISQIVREVELLHVWDRQALRMPGDDDSEGDDDDAFMRVMMDNRRAGAGTGANNGAAGGAGHTGQGANEGGNNAQLNPQPSAFVFGANPTAPAPLPTESFTFSVPTHQSDDEMPPLESANAPSSPVVTSSVLAASTSTVVTPLPAAPASPPSDPLALARLAVAQLDQVSSTPPAPTPTASSSKPTPAPKSNPSSSNAKPTLKLVDAPVATPAKRPIPEDSDDNKPPLEAIAPRSSSAGPGVPASAQPTVGPGVLGDDSEEGSDDDDENSDEWEDDDEDDADEDTDINEDEDEDDYEDEDDSDDECIYPDGLPTDPLLPLLFVSRPFLHAARQLLYRHLHVSGAYQASLLLRSLSAEKHAARTADEDAFLTEQKEGEGQGGAKNALAGLVRTLSLEVNVGVSLGRGGGQLYIGLIRKTGPNLEVLKIGPMFLESATKLLRAALSQLPRLRRLDIESESDSDKPFLVTSPRIFAIQRTSPELEDLAVQNLYGTDDGPMREAIAMWDQADMMDEEDTEESESDGEEGGKRTRTRAKGLKTLALHQPDIRGDELGYILRDSQETLTTLHICHPGPSFQRFALATTLLTYGANLTELNLELSATWSPKPKPIVKVPFPLRPKNYENDEPQPELLFKIAAYPYILDAVVPYLPKLEILKFDGPQASTSIFSYLPASLRTISWAHCPAIQPAALGRLLGKAVTRTKRVIQADGARISQQYKTAVAPGLICMKVDHDDLSWRSQDLRILESAAKERGMCLHLSGEVPLGAGGAGGLGRGGGAGARLPIPAVPFGGLALRGFVVMGGGGGGVGGGGAGGAGGR